MKTIRAIYIGDVRYNECPVFELDKKTGMFEMLKDKEFRYGIDSVRNDPDFLVFAVENEEASMISKEDI